MPPRFRPWRALAAAVVVGGAVAFWAGTALDGSGVRFELGSWAVLWGTVAALVAYGLGGGGRVGRFVLAVMTTVVAAGAWWWIVVWRVPLLTLEGAWLYPLAGLATLAAAAAIRALRHRRASDR